MKIRAKFSRAVCAAQFLAGAVLLAATVQAQDCTVSPWSSSVGLTDSDVGTPNEGMARFSGFCGLSVPVDGTARYLTDDTPFGESAYRARFYARVSGTDSPIMIFSADDGIDPVMSVWANRPDPGWWQLRVTNAGGGIETLSISAPNEVWHYVSVVWEASSFAAIEFAVDFPIPATTEIDTSGLTVDEVQLGNIAASDSGGTIGFDSFASRRISNLDLLPAGDADGDGIYTGADQIAIYKERLDNQLASGQPDCDGDGDVDQQDSDCLRTERFGELSFPVISASNTSIDVTGPDMLFDNGFEPVQ